MGDIYDEARRWYVQRTVMLEPQQDEMQPGNTSYLVARIYNLV